MKSLKLNRNLRRDILRGHPWVYQKAFSYSQEPASGEICKLLDSKSKFVAWVYFNEGESLGCRVLTTKEKPPNWNFWQARFQTAYELRKPVRRSDNNSYRLFNGEGDLLPGLVCDIYDKVAVLQTDGPSAGHFWPKDKIVGWLRENLELETIVDKSRGNQLEILYGDADLKQVSFLENAIHFKADILNGQKTGFFLDQRDNRQYVRGISQGREVLNLFSYTGGFSASAGLGGAHNVTSVDLSPDATKLAQENWLANDLPADQHKAIAANVFDFLEEADKKWNLIIIDPPSMAHSEKHKEQAVKKYTDCFAAGLRKLQKGGDICLSSCSSHIHFDDFLEIISQSLSAVRKTARILRISGQGPDHPYPHACPEMRYLKFIHLKLDES